jgi:hypothetical protein
VVSSLFATAAEPPEDGTVLGRLGGGKFEEEAHSRLADVVGRLLSALDTLSVEPLRPRRVDSQQTTSGRGVAAVSP